MSLNLGQKIQKIENKYFLDRDAGYFTEIMAGEHDPNCPIIKHEMYNYGLIKELDETPVFQIDASKKVDNDHIVQVTADSRKILTTASVIARSTILYAMLDKDNIKLDVPYEEARSLINFLRYGVTYDKTFNAEKWLVIPKKYPQLPYATTYSRLTNSVNALEVYESTTKVGKGKTASFVLEVGNNKTRSLQDLMLCIDVPVGVDNTPNIVFDIIKKISLTLDKTVLSVDSSWIYLSERFFNRKTSVSADNVQLMFGSSFFPIYRIILYVNLLDNNHLPLDGSIKKINLDVEFGDKMEVLNVVLLGFASPEKKPAIKTLLSRKHISNILTNRDGFASASYNFEQFGILKDMVIKVSNLVYVSITNGQEEIARYDSMMLQTIFPQRCFKRRITGDHYYLTFSLDTTETKFCGGLKGPYTLTVVAKEGAETIDLFTRSYVTIMS